MGNETWKPLSSPFVRINFDAALKKNDNHSCSRLVVRDSIGRVLGVKFVLNDNMPSAFVAEALACVQGLQLGVDLRFRDVEVEGDVRHQWREIEKGVYLLEMGWVLKKTKEIKGCERRGGSVEVVWCVEKARNYVLLFSKCIGSCA
ncbi:hypothetical protein GOBAR_AA03314 [Gossypium barbadense]|uniref:RNase H type-1 domain-containing protein n=1 Tax=Gossypium barbadense TaxID=3634 RepID=A0A2P5YNV3_GOSBA|nr:hypothetical protein GOBAR_AA03314 [Gossypium barbadense]